MARPAAIALGGYFPTPPRLIPSIARLLRLPAVGDFAVIDPVAGDGHAIAELLIRLCPNHSRRVANARIYGCEMEAVRAKAAIQTASKAVGQRHQYILHGDAFRIVGAQPKADWAVGASLLYLNPPYEPDKEHGRLEERFLARFAHSLCEDGVLVFVVPFYALTASAATLAREFADLRCYRFPDGEFERFKQVVLIGRKIGGRQFADAQLERQVRQWAASGATIPVLPEDGADSTRIPTHEDRVEGRVGFYGWDLAPLDMEEILANLRPWHVTDRNGRLLPIESVIPSDDVASLLTRRYPLAMPPRAAHIAAGIAAGIFNGSRVEPNDPKSGLPAILVKGVFDKDFVPIDEKRNKDGEKVGEVQVQQPRLVVTALDLSTSTYVTIKSSAEQTGATALADMTTADLLAAYGKGLLAVMLEQCPVLHDPAQPGDVIPLPALARPLYTAQAHAVMATVKLLGGPAATPRQRRGKAAFVLGEIGSGKSSIALATAKAIGAKRPLILCPPHLLESWVDQAAAVVPDADTMILREPADVDAFAALEGDGMMVGILSRETAKLGHAWGAVQPVTWARDTDRKPIAVCPSCGADVTTDPEEIVRTRARCKATRMIPTNRAGRLVDDIAVMLSPALGHHVHVINAMRGARRSQIRERQTTRFHMGEAWQAIRTGEGIVRQAHRLARLACTTAGAPQREAIVAFAAAINRPDVTATLAERMYQRSLKDPSAYGTGSEIRDAARDLMLLLPAAEQSRLEGVLRSLPVEDGYGRRTWNAWDQARTALATGQAHYRLQHSLTTESIHGLPFGSADLAAKALSVIAVDAGWRKVECGEPLFQALPTPRRIPLATYITRRFSRAFDMLVIDEGHEYAGDGTAQSHAAHRLTGLGLPTLLLTGSVMNGYADSLFANQWALDPEFRAEFPRGARQEFVKRYGYLKRLVEEKDAKGKRVVFGSMSDRVVSAKTVGQSPGVLPLFLLRYLLRIAVTIHKADLALDLPTCHEVVATVEAGAELGARIKSLQEALVTQIKEDRFTELSGKLWGQLAELPSYLDRATADAGNRPDGSYEIAYPEATQGGVVATQAPLPASNVLPKEQWMLDMIAAELAEGRNVMVFAWHKVVLTRLARLIETDLDEPCPILDAGKVQAAKRQAWIDQQVIGKKRRVLVVNPVAVQTGLNNLVHFATEIWMQNPACNPATYRQATGRVDRIGQKLETRIYFPVYADTLQAALHRLLMHKVAVSVSADGLDAQSALEAAGVGVAEHLDSLAVGKQLYELIEAGAVASRRVQVATPALHASPRPRLVPQGQQLSLLEDM